MMLYRVLNEISFEVCSSKKRVTLLSGREVVLEPTSPFTETNRQEPGNGFDLRKKRESRLFDAKPA